MLRFTSIVLIISILAVSQSARVSNRDSATQASQRRSFGTQTSQTGNFATQRSDESWNFGEQQLDQTRTDDRRSFVALQPDQSQSFNEPKTDESYRSNTQRSDQSRSQNAQQTNYNRNVNTQRPDQSRSHSSQNTDERRSFVALQPDQSQSFDESRTGENQRHNTQRPNQSRNQNTQRPSGNQNINTQRQAESNGFNNNESQNFNTQRPGQNRNQNTQRPNENRNVNTQRPEVNQGFNTHRADDNRRLVAQTSQCNTFEWQCDNGQCIDSSESCDGVLNCRDGSDETTENCIATSCPRYAFRCTYGACVAGNAECNRKIDCVDGSDEATEKCPTKNEEQLHGSCDRNSFQCDNGQCISVDSMCDGNPDCSDLSDETVRYCAGTHCPTYAFRCGNGACISGKKKCDSRIDCTDGSDENWALCGRSKNHTITVRPPIYQVNPLQTVTSATPFQTVTSYTTPPSNIGSCRADNIPVNGDAYYQYDRNKKVSYGEIVENFVSVNYSCIENHYLIGNGTNICIGGRWQSATPQCKPRCNTAEIQGVTISANCFSIINNTQKSTSCVRPVEPGTIAYVSCQRGYEKTGPQQTLTCRSDGRWSPQPQKCTQICGEINEGSAYVVGGTMTNVSRVPWHVGVYKKNSYDGKFQQICGGTIITSRVIISAMHCFWDASEDTAFRPEAFQVAVGKTLRDYSAREEYKPQFFAIEHIFHIDGYNDLANYYADDISILILDKHIEFHSFIVPICLPQNLEYHEKIVPVGWRGTVAGWGLEQSNGQPSPILKKIELPVVSREECKEKSSPEFSNFITSDKFCAGYLTGASVCQGDSGGGLVFPQTIRQKTTYIIRGIVSTGGNKAGSCDSDKYTTFTNIAFHMDFINAHISKYEPKY